MHTPIVIIIGITVCLVPVALAVVRRRRQPHIAARGVTRRAIGKPELPGGSNERLIGKYLHHLATEWWAGQSREVATCDACSAEPVRRGEGYMIGSSLWCDNCYRNKDVEGQLRRNPDAAGYGVLQRARLWVETRGKEH
jgi:hypothetical protein